MKEPQHIDYRKLASPFPTNNPVEPRVKPCLEKDFCQLHTTLDELDGLLKQLNAKLAPVLDVPEPYKETIPCCPTNLPSANQSAVNATTKLKELVSEVQKTIDLLTL